MFIHEILLALEHLAPFSLQEDYDNSGLIIGSSNNLATGIFFSLDLTEQVLNEAENFQCNTIINHHPYIFHPLKKIHSSNAYDKIIYQAIKRDFNIIAIHTNLDNVLHGVNKTIADKLNLAQRKILSPLKKQLNQIISTENTHANFGAGLVGYLPEPLPPKSFLEFLSLAMNLRVFKYNICSEKPIHKVAVCGGAGSFLIPQAHHAQAQAFISADFKYSDFFKATPELALFDIGHYESESLTENLLFDYFKEKFPNFANLKKGLSTNPISYFVKN